MVKGESSSPPITHSLTKCRKGRQTSESRKLRRVGMNGEGHILHYGCYLRKRDNNVGRDLRTLFYLQQIFHFHFECLIIQSITTFLLSLIHKLMDGFSYLTPNNAAAI